jgi:hypothetical protein
LYRASPLLSHFAASRDSALPTIIAAWKAAQTADPAFLADIPPASLLLCDGLSLHKDANFPSRIFVPPTLREALTRQHHADLQHVFHPKVPTMKADVQRFVQDCEHCENEKTKRRLAHGMFADHHTDKPRSLYTMDFQGQGQTITDETEALAILDSFTKNIPNREAASLAPRLLDEVFFTVVLWTSCRNSWRISPLLPACAHYNLRTQRSMQRGN